QTSGRFFQADQYQSVTIRNCSIENTMGIEVDRGLAGSSVLITRNRQHNIQGNGTNPVGNFVQFRTVKTSTIDVSWNEIVNDYNHSDPEDIISLFNTDHARIHDNMLWGQSTPGNAYNTSSQGGITAEGTATDNEIWNNQIVDGMGINFAGGS